jgi:hypothetical protein
MRELWRETERTGENLREQQGSGEHGTPGSEKASSGAEQGKTRFFTAKTEWRWTEDGTRERK